MTDITVAARRFLVEQPDVTSLLGSSATYKHWLFRLRPFVQIEGTGKCAMVLSRRAGWAPPNRHNTAQFPRLQVEILADDDRELGTPNPANRAAHDKAIEVFEAVDLHLHRPHGGATFFNDVRVLGSTRLGEPDVTPVPGGDGVMRLLVEYGLMLG